MDDETKKYILFVIVLLFIDQIWKINSFWGLIITITIICIIIIFTLFYLQFVNIQINVSYKDFDNIYYTQNNNTLCN